jgi:hypothetical protein
VGVAVGGIGVSVIGGTHALNIQFPQLQSAARNRSVGGIAHGVNSIGGWAIEYYARVQGSLKEGGVQGRWRFKQQLRVSLILDQIHSFILPDYIEKVSS